MEMTDRQDCLGLLEAMMLLDMMRALDGQDWIDWGRRLLAVGARRIGFR